MKYLDYKERRQQGTYEFPLAFYHMDPTGHRYQMTCHWHPEYEIIRIIQGSFRLTLDGQLYLAGQGDILFIHAGVLHGGIPDHCIYECIVFDPKLLLGGNHICNKWLSRLIKNEIRLPVLFSGIDREIDRTARELFSLLNNRSRGFEFMTQGMLYQLLGLLYGLEQYHCHDGKKPAGRRYIERLKGVITYIENHYTEVITLETMAEIADLNPRYFCRFFKKLTDRTPIEYLNYYRIECACRQLLDGAASVTENAYSCGFNDSSYFIKVFHDTKGMTPKQFQELGEGEGADRAAQGSS